MKVKYVYEGEVCVWRWSTCLKLSALNKWNSLFCSYNKGHVNDVVSYH